MTASIRLSELGNVTHLDNNDLLLVTDSESASSRKLTIGELKENIFSGDSFSSFNDVDITTTPPTDGQFLRYSSIQSKWIPGDISLSSLGELNDVDLVTEAPVTGQTIIWNGTKFTPGDIDLSPIYSILGEDPGNTDLGIFVGSPYLGDNKNLRQHLQSLSNAISSEAFARTGDVESIDGRLQTAETSVSNLEVAMAPETLNSINELAQALGDDPAAFANLQTNHTNLDTRVTSIEGDNATQTELNDAVQSLMVSLGGLNSDKANKSGDTFTGVVNIQDHLIVDDSNNLATEYNLNVKTSGSSVFGVLGNGSVLLGNSASTPFIASSDHHATSKKYVDDAISALGQAGSPPSLDTINELAATLAKLVPIPPTTLDGLPLVVDTNGGTRRLCVGFTDRTGGTSGYSAGDNIKRNTDGSITTNKIEDVGPGDSGGIAIKISENTYDVTTTMASGTQVVDFMGLKITDNKDANLSTRDTGIAEGFYQVYDIQLVNAHLQNETNGLHYIEFDHAGNKTQKAYFYEDESTPGVPTLNTSSMYMPSSPDYNYSSGVPHYSNSTDNEFDYSLLAENLSGEMYINHTVASSSQTSGFTHEGNKTYTDFGGTNPPASNFGVGDQKTAQVYQYPRDLHIQVGSNQFSNWTITTPYGSASARPSLSLKFNIMGNTARTNVIDEDNILVSSVGSGSGNSYRVGDAAGDNPVSSQSVWDPTVSPQPHEAIIVGGVLKHDNTDYSSGYRPIGPDLSTRALDPQYAEFEIKRSGVSQFNINYSGSCDGCWVTMPNNTAWQNSLSDTNGWADMFQSYRGTGVPTSAESGCSSGGVMDNNGGSFTCVFGTESSSNDPENSILIRWKLANGQSITSMSFTA